MFEAFAAFAPAVDRHWAALRIPHPIDAHQSQHSILRTWAGGEGLTLVSPFSTYFGYVYEGDAILETGSAFYTLKTGMYFCALPGMTIRWGCGILIEHEGYTGTFMIGGPIEEKGRLKYIDGCTDSLLIPPLKLGDPCLNALYFPPGTDQTQHTHPSVRMGLVVRGSGECVTPEATVNLEPGVAFVIPSESLHAFRTQSADMTVIAYHPDSDYGPTDEDHPMINRTIVNGTSAALIDRIRTK